MLDLCVYFLLPLIISAFICLYCIENIGNDFFQIMSGIGLLFCVIMFIGFPFLAYNMLAAERKALVINAEYNTNYTKLDIFYASDVIETIQQIKRQRIEINGNLFTGENRGNQN